MKKLLAVLILANMLTCSNNSSPGDLASIKDQDTQYGVCVIALPKIAMAKTPAEKFIFDLAITGPGMEPMKFSWYLGGVDTQATIYKIPPGDMRVFTGTLTGSAQGVTHIGADTVAIIAGKTAYVNLYMRQTGNAVVNVIIEDAKTPGMTGCYTFEGRIDTTTFKNMKLKIISDSLSTQMLGYLYQDNGMIGKVYGPQPSISGPVYWTISFASSGLFQLEVYGDQTAFKGTVFGSSDTKLSVGYASGYRTSCDTVVTPPPVILSGCYTFEGNIDTTKFNNAILQILPGSPGELYGVVTQNGQTIAKVSGFQPIPGSGAPVSWVVSLAYSGTYILKVTANENGSYYKTYVYNPSDTIKEVGYIWGNKTSCDTVILPPVTLSGCYTFMGNIDTIKLQNTILRILSDPASPAIVGAVTQNLDTVGLISGPRPSANAAPVTWQLKYFLASPLLLLKVAFDGSGTAYKSVVYDPSDTSKTVGVIYGQRTSCDTMVSPQTCVIDTMGGESSCKPMSLWTTYASSSCAERGMSLNWISPMVPCTDGKDTANYRWVCFQCCNE